VVETTKQVRMTITTQHDLSRLESSCWHPRRLELLPLHSSEPEARSYRIASVDFETDLASRVSRDESCRVWRWDGRCRLLPVDNGLSQKDNTNEPRHSMTLANGTPTFAARCQNVTISCAMYIYKNLFHRDYRFGHQFFIFKLQTLQEREPTPSHERTY